jgi:hypothetical protein
MRLLLILSLLCSSLSAFAASVKITSFVYVAREQYLAELCGVVEGGEAPSFIRLKIDHLGRRPAIYNTVAGNDGRFCQAVVTYRGEAEASVMGSGVTTNALVK